MEYQFYGLRVRSNGMPGLENIAASWRIQSDVRQ